MLYVYSLIVGVISGVVTFILNSIFVMDTNVLIAAYLVIVAIILIVIRLAYMIKQDFFNR
jgi:uncharacterized membrane protein